MHGKSKTKNEAKVNKKRKKGDALISFSIHLTLHLLYNCFVPDSKSLEFIVVCRANGTKHHGIRKRV